MPRTYTISRSGLRSLLWRSARLSFALTALLIAIVLRLPIGGEEEHTAGWVLGYMGLVLMLCTWLAARSTRRTWRSFQLELGEDFLHRIQARMPEITVQRAEVTQLEEIRGRGIVVRTADSERFIFVPAGLEGYPEVRETLAGWAPITTLSAMATWKRQWLGVGLAVLMVGWMIATMVSKTVWFVLPSGFVICVFLLWAFMAAQRSLHLARSAKLGMWCVLFPILGLALKSAYLLAAIGDLP